MKNRFLQCFVLVSFLLLSSTVFPFSYYAVEVANIGNTSAVISFGWTATTVIIYAPATNTAAVCLDWDGGTAVCPSANTAGNDVIPPGASITLDANMLNKSISHISVIAASGTQTLYVRAFQ